MASNWKYLYLHTGDILKLGEKGGVLGRKKSRDKQLFVDDDLPGSKFDFGGKPENRQIFTLPHGSRAVPVVTKLKEPNYIEGGENISFSNGIVDKHEELERGRIVFEKGEYISLENLTKESLKKILKSAKKTSVEFWQAAKPSMAGLCGDQYAQALIQWRKNPKVGIKVTTDAPDTIPNGNLEGALQNILQTENPRQYITEDTIHLLEFIILIELLDNLWSEDAVTARNSKLKEDTVLRFKRLFEQLKSRHGYPSKVILPLSRGDDIEDIACDLAKHFNLEEFLPFLRNGPNFADFKDWLGVLKILKEYFPTMSHLSWMETQEGNDASMTKEMKTAGLGNVVIDLLSVIMKHFDSPNVPNMYRNLGIQVRESATFHHGHRVVCDRKTQGDLPINALMELYDDNCNRIGNSLEVGNAPALTHKPDNVNYDTAAWLVLRVGDTTLNREIPRPIFDGDTHSDFRPNNPWEAFVTLPWFIQFDKSRQSQAVGYLDDCSEQLVHVHFLNGLEHNRQSFVIIPVKHRKGGDRFNLNDGQNKSFTTVCFRSMYSNSPYEEHHQEHERVNHNRAENIAAIPGLKWWIERPSTLFW